MKLNGSVLSVALAFTAGLITACNLTSHASSSGADLGNLHIQVFRAHKTADDAMRTDSVQTGSTGVQPAATVMATGSAIGTSGGFLCRGHNETFASREGLVPCSEASATHVQIHSALNSTMAVYSMSAGTLQPMFQLVYTSNDCTGTPYAGNGVGTLVLENGAAFREHGGGDSDASTYWYLAPGTATTTIDMGSYREPVFDANGNFGTCTAQSSPNITVYPVVQNDPNVSGVGNSALGALVVQ